MTKSVHSTASQPGIKSAPLWLLWLRRLSGLALGLGVAAAVSGFPMGRPVIGLFLLLYAALLYRFPWVWLIVVPAMLPVVDLALWSGRFFFDEFDFLLMTTLAILYWRRSDGQILPGLVAPGYRLAALFALSCGIGVIISLSSLPAVDINSFSNYDSPYNALRVAKGFFLVWLLLPFLFRDMAEHPLNTKARLLAGITAGLALAGLCVLWERGVFVDLFWGGNRYALLQGLLDFTGSYRITGMFSGMNVGDTAIDSYLALAVPISLYFVIYGKSPWIRLAGLGVFGLGAYSVIVTFSRGLYAGFALALAIIALFQLFKLRHHIRANRFRTLMLAIIFLMATCLLFFLYTSGGYEALVIAIAALLAGTLGAPRLKVDNKALTFIAAVFGALVTAWMIHRAIGHHKWSTTAADTAFGLSAAAGLILWFLPVAFARRLDLRLNLSTSVIAALMLAIFWVGSIPPLSGIRVLERFSTTSEDLGTREKHWHDSFAAMPDGWLTPFFGAGVGSYPRLFFASQIGKLPLASYRFDHDDKDTFMTLGAGDFNMIQRINLKPYTTYAVKLDFRALKPAAQPKDMARVVVKLCHKHILYSERYVSDCKTEAIQSNSGNQWTASTILLNSGVLGRYGPFYWPTTFMLQNGGSGIIQITHIAVTGPDGVNLISNGDFAEGGDRWILISDFEHLAWHAKNMFLHLYFEQGILGLLCFITIMVMALYRLLNDYRKGDASALFRLAALLAYAFVGFFGSNLDMPSVATLFFLILFSPFAPKPSTLNK